MYSFVWNLVVSALGRRICNHLAAKENFWHPHKLGPHITIQSYDSYAVFDLWGPCLGIGDTKTLLLSLIWLWINTRFVAAPSVVASAWYVHASQKKKKKKHLLQRCLPQTRKFCHKPMSRNDYSSLLQTRCF